MTTAAHTRARKWLWGTVAVALGVALSLALAEVALRLFDLAPVGSLATVTQREFERIPGMFSPGQSLVERLVPQLPYRITIDSLGYRDAGQLPRTKPAGEVRVLMLGDSFTFGYLVDDDKTLPADVERLLRSRCGDGVRVINAGVPGSSIETAAGMADRSLSLGIDVAVITFVENDVTDLPSAMWTQLATNRAAKSRFPMSLVYPWARQLALWNLVMEARGKWRARKTTAVLPVRLAPEASGPNQALLKLRDEYRQRLTALRDRLAGAGVPLVFAIYPSHRAVYDSLDEQVRWVERTAREAGLTTVDLTPPLQRDGRPKEELFLFPYDGHPSVAGYALVSPSLADTLMAVPVLKDRCTAAR